MIRLIASDIDGTLLHNGAAEIDPVIFEEIHRLKQKGILFCPASGRQYHSLRRLFAPAADELTYLCENGAVLFGPGNPGQLLGQTVMERDRALDLIDDIRAQFPVELGEAKKLVASRNDYIAAAKREAEVIRKQAEAEAQRMLAEESVLNQAKQRSAELMRQAEERSRELKRSANEYCEDALRRTEEAVAEAYDEIKKSRARFRAAASATAAGSPSGGRAAYDAAAEED